VHKIQRLRAPHPFQSAYVGRACFWIFRRSSASSCKVLVRVSACRSCIPTGGQCCDLELAPGRSQNTDGTINKQVIISGTCADGQHNKKCSSLRFSAASNRTGSLDVVMAITVHHQLRPVPVTACGEFDFIMIFPRACPSGQSFLCAVACTWRWRRSQSLMHDDHSTLALEHVVGRPVAGHAGA